MSLPNRKVVWVINRITVFVRHYSVFGEGTIEDFDLSSSGLLTREKLKRVESGFVFLVSEIDVSLGEGSSFNVLASEAQIVAFGVECEESEGLTGRPIEFVLLDGFQPLLDVELLNSGMYREIWREEATCLGILFQKLNIESRRKLVSEL